MRLRGNRARIAFFVAVFLFALVALLPLRLAVGWLGLEEKGFAAREAAGSLWLGSFAEAQFADVRIGDLQARLRTLPLLIGRARIDLARGGDAAPFEGAVTVSRHGFGVDDITAALDLGGGALPVDGLDAADLSARFAGGACAAADGLVKARLGPHFAALTKAETMSGNARCDGGALLLPLRSQSGMEALDLRLLGNGAYRAELTLRSADPALAPSLAAAGFAPVPGGYRLTVSGAF